MTTIYHREIECANCGHENTIYNIGSTNAFGSPDLDGRPPEMQRRTMIYWVQSCEKCGIATPDITWLNDNTLNYFRSAEFRSTHDAENFRELAETFWTAHLIALKEGETNSALSFIRYASWACDDQGDTAEAKRAREIFLDLVNENGSGPQMISSEGPLAGYLVLADTSRRAGRFDDARNAAAKVAEAGESFYSNIAWFIVELCDKNDTGCYNIRGKKVD